MIKHKSETPKETKPEEIFQEVIQFDAVQEEELPVVNLFDIDDIDDLKKVEQIPAWKRRFLKK